MTSLEKSLNDLLFNRQFYPRKDEMISGILCRIRPMIEKRDMPVELARIHRNSLAEKSSLYLVQKMNLRYKAKLCQEKCVN
jgi:hypothetical protein